MMSTETRITKLSMKPKKHHTGPKQNARCAQGHSTTGKGNEGENCSWGHH